MSTAVQELLAVLDLEQLEVNLFRGLTPPTRLHRVFGGQVIGQALVAACRTTDLSDRLPHSLHAYFLLGGDPAVPIVYSVERIRDGKSFSTRRVTAIQHGEPIFSMEVSFHRTEESFDHQAKMPDVPKPSELPDEATLRQKVLPHLPEPVRRFYERERPIDLRPIEFQRYLGKKITDPNYHVWFRASGPLPDDVIIHRSVLAYASDMTLLDTALIPHGTTVFSSQIMAASLDHALWIHRPFRADQWLLFSHDTPNLSGARGFVRGLIFAEDGTLVASVAQEGSLRRRREDLGGRPVIPN
jgi:acyl-CoA thioesterase-2